MKRAAALVLVLVAGCSRAITPPLTITAKRQLPAVHVLVVMPASNSLGASDVPADAADVVGQLLLDAASRQTVWSVVDPKRAQTTLATIPADSMESRAGTLATRLRADAALTATVATYRNRVGSAYGVSEPASVSIQIWLVAAGEKHAAWKGDYTVTQEPLAYNLWNLWGVVRGGPKWLTADELARIGVDEAVERLAASNR